MDGDGDWSFNDGCLELIGREWGGIEPFSHKNLTLGVFRLTLTVNSGVWIVSLKHLWVVLYVIESVPGVSTVATFVHGVAVHDLLLGKVQENSGSDEMSGLDSGGGGERPA